MLRTKLQWMTLKQRRPLQQLKAVYRCVHGMAPEYLQSLFSRQPGTVCTRGEIKLSLRVKYLGSLSNTVVPKAGTFYQTTLRPHQAISLSPAK